MSALPSPEAKPLLRVDDALASLDGVVGRSAFYAAIARDEVPGVVRLGRRVYLSNARFREWTGLKAHSNGAHDADGDGAP